MAQYQTKQREYRSRMPYIHAETHTTSSPMGRLAVAIILQAVNDWDERIKRRAWRWNGCMTSVPFVGSAGTYSTFDEIRLFFRHGFIDLLLPDGSALTPETMLDILERRLQAAMEADTEWMQEQEKIQADAASAHASA